MLNSFFNRFWPRSVAVGVIVSLLSALPVPCGYAQVALIMPPPGQMLHITDPFEPATMAGMRMDLRDPFNFYFIMNKGEEELSSSVKKDEYEKLIKYFLASLTIPNEDMWVNLSPYESSRILPDNFAQTSMGRDLLAQDYILKQFASSLMYPEDDLGRKFWDKVYAQAFERFGTTDIPVDTFNKVWIIADRADIYQKDDTVFLVDSHLKVMLEQDFMAIEKNTNQFGRSQALEEVSLGRRLASDIVREIIIPVIEEEVNHGENFAMVRQVYSAMIMATWFKKSLRESLLGQSYVDQSKSPGVQVDDPQAAERIYQQYLEAYRVGVFDLIKEEVDPLTDEVLVRKYFSGGMMAPTDFAMFNEVDSWDAAQALRKISGLDLPQGLDVALTSLATEQKVFEAPENTQKSEKPQNKGNVVKNEGIPEDRSRGIKRRGRKRRGREREGAASQAAAKDAADRLIRGLGPKGNSISKALKKSADQDKKKLQDSLDEKIKVELGDVRENELRVAERAVLAVDPDDMLKVFGAEDGTVDVEGLDVSDELKEHIRAFAARFRTKAEKIAVIDVLIGRLQQEIVDMKEELLRGELKDRIEALDKRAANMEKRGLKGATSSPPEGSQDGAQAPFGGIDLGDEYLKINIKVDGQGMPLPLEMQDPAMIHIDGLTPIIREIVPISPANVPILSDLMTEARRSSV